MSAEQYVNIIIKKIKCSKKKRNEIKQQLLSDISISLENGESLERIMARMGSVDAVAREFNQNMSQEELLEYKKSKGTKTILSVAVILFILVCLGYWAVPKSAEIGKSGVFEEAAVEQQVQKVVQELDANDFKALKEESTDDMQSLLNEENIDSARAEVSADDWGALQSFGNAYMAEKKQRGQLYVVVEVNVAYENIGVTYTLAFDDEMKLAGLYMR